MLYSEPMNFLTARRDSRVKALARSTIRASAHGRLEADEIIDLRAHLVRCVVFGEVGVDDRVLYLRWDGRGLLVREIIHGVVTTAYSIEGSLSVRDFALELAVIDGIISNIELRAAERARCRLRA